eukprot:Lithocolla_globosa_v1_NODE_527_length_3806_cov_53.570515.p3 type:complete len:141 gc:universal NODE_527_length_3806_cov_53.570515:917-495(-)
MPSQGAIRRHISLELARKRLGKHGRTTRKLHKPFYGWLIIRSKNQAQELKWSNCCKGLLSSCTIKRVLKHQSMRLAGGCFAKAKKDTKTSPQPKIASSKKFCVRTSKPLYGHCLTPLFPSFHRQRVGVGRFQVNNTFLSG